MPGDGAMRASHQEREATVQALRDAYVAGRLDLEELRTRAGRAYSARTWGDLRSLTADLPIWPAVPGWPGFPAQDLMQAHMLGLPTAHPLGPPQGRQPGPHAGSRPGLQPGPRPGSQPGPLPGLRPGPGPRAGRSRPPVLVLAIMVALLGIGVSSWWPAILILVFMMPALAAGTPGDRQVPRGSPRRRP